MGKIFRLHDSGKNTLQGWEDTPKYDANVIKNITDPNGGKSKKAITSIPSPFAQIDLVRVAFEQVVKIGLNGDTKYHEIVSNALDVAQIFFEWDKFKDKFELIEWNIKNKVEELVDSNDIGHKQLGDTLNLFLVQDAKQNNFNQLTDIYLLNYKYGPKPLNIIGATSPVTLFFAPANDLSYLSDEISFGNDKAFDSGFTPLYKRDIEFHKWWWYLKKSITDFPTLFKAVDSYLMACFTASDSVRRNDLNGVVNGTGNNSNYVTLNFGINNGNIVKILQNTLPIKSKNVVNSSTSDFAIKTTKSVFGTPLALQPNFTQSWNYHSNIAWDRYTVVPYYDKRALSERTLPGEGSQYPYLTTSDFLEDNIIVLDGKMNDDMFFNAGWKNEDNFPLIPIKEEYFKYFSVGDLMGTIGGKKVLEIQKVAAGIDVILRIPVNANNGQSYIEYQRTYYERSTPADRDRNEGKVASYCDITFAMSPNVKGVGQYYFGLINSNDRNFDIECYLDNQKQNVSDPTIRDPQGKDISKMYLLNGDFDRLKFVNDWNEMGFIIPLMKNQANANQFTFAIDFGTTNTHIEYSVNGQSSQPFVINQDNAHIVYLQDMSEFNTHLSIFNSDFIPEVIGDVFKFPMRTSLLAHQNVDWNAPKTILDANLDFTYKKYKRRSYNRSYTGLKWANDNFSVQRIERYVESIFVMLRHKVLSEGGALATTKIIWTYPNSMSVNRQSNIRRIFRTAYTTYIDSNLNNISELSESVAPYIHFYNTQNAVNNIVTVDIGGGTSDIVFAQNKAIKYITSFRFAADAIFGDAYTIGNGNNGIIKQFGDKLIENINNETVTAMYDDIKNGPSNDIASFLFSLSSHPEIKDKQLRKTIDFNRKLNLDETQKIVFVLFYAALVYHIAQIMKDKNLGMPRHIAFSGNGSKILSVLADDNRILEDFAKCIFELIYGAKYDSNGLSIIYQPDKNPKESTAKGAILYMTQPNNYANVMNPEVIVGGNVAGKTYEEIANYLKLNNSEVNIKETEDFFDFIFELNKKFNFADNFGVDSKSVKIVKDNCCRDLANYLRNGIESKLKDVVDIDKYVDETFFFYPIIGVLNAIESEIAKSNL